MCLWPDSNLDHNVFLRLVVSYTLLRGREIGASFDNVYKRWLMSIKIIVSVSFAEINIFKCFEEFYLILVLLPLGIKDQMYISLSEIV